MAHVDDGILNALLDGELDDAEAAEVRAHLAACPACEARFQDAKRFLEAAAELLEVLTPASLNAPPVVEAPRQAEAPPAPAQPVRPEHAIVAPISPVAPAGPAAPSAPARRVSKTAKEVAIDLDGATHQSPAILPNVPGEGEEAPVPRSPSSGHEIRSIEHARRGPAPRRPDWATLAWAASVVLALGVGYLANEVQHQRGAGLREGEGTLPVAATAPPPAARGQAPAAAAAGDRQAVAQGKDLSALAAGTARSKPGDRGAAKTPSAPAPMDAMPLAGAGPPAARRLQPAPAQISGAAGAPTAAAEIAGRGPPSAAARAAAVPPPTPFRETNVDSAAMRLSGILRTIEGMSLASVKIGSGALVPGALPTLDVVRLAYTDPRGIRLQLDQQRLPQPRDTSREARARSVPAGLGIAYGDTLVTFGPAGEARIRWLDEAGLWMSFSGNLAADSLRALLRHIR